MIKSLTKEQEAKFPEYVKKWTDIGLSSVNSEPEDREVAEKMVREAYKVAGLEEPEIILWADSQISGLFLLNEIHNRNEDGDKEWDDEGLELKDLEEEVQKTPIERKLQYNDQELRFVETYYNEYMYGQHEAHWLAFYDFFRTECNLVNETAPVAPLIELAKHAGWWLALENFAIVCRKHTEIHMDEQGRLHNRTGPAIAYRDGFKLYMIHGIRVDEQVVMDPNSISADQIINEQNLELRRIMIDQLGVEEFLKRADAEKVNADDFGTLWRVELPQDEALVMVEVVNSSPERDIDGNELINEDGNPIYKNYFLRVPPNIKSAKQAVAWTFNMEEHEYKPVKQA